MQLQQFNQLSHSEMTEALTRCCASRQWVEQMIAQAPFESLEQLEQAAHSAADKLSADDWLQAFAAHPLIGDPESLAKRFANTRQWAGNEQQSVDTASQQTLEQLALLNREYYSRHGFIFIVFAHQKTAEQMLALLQQRLPNPSPTELKNAAAEQLKITLLRLNKLIAHDAGEIEIEKEGAHS